MRERCSLDRKWDALFVEGWCEYVNDLSHVVIRTYRNDCKQAGPEDYHSAPTLSQAKKLYKLLFSLIEIRYLPLVPASNCFHEAAVKQNGTDTDTDAAATASFIDFEREVQDWRLSGGLEQAPSRACMNFAAHLSEK